MLSSGHRPVSRRESGGRGRVKGWGGEEREEKKGSIVVYVRGGGTKRRCVVRLGVFSPKNSSETIIQHAHDPLRNNTPHRYFPEQVERSKESVKRRQKRLPWLPRSCSGTSNNRRTSNFLHSAEFQISSTCVLRHAFLMILRAILPSTYNLPTDNSNSPDRADLFTGRRQTYAE